MEICHVLNMKIVSANLVTYFPPPWVSEGYAKIQEEGQVQVMHGPVGEQQMWITTRLHLSDSKPYPITW